MTVSRGTLLALAAGAVFLAIVAWPLARSLWRWALAALGASVVALVLMYLLNPASRMHLSSRASATNLDARFVLVSDALADIANAPWLGTGPSVRPSVHNVLLQQLVDFGVVGGLVMGVLLVAVVVWWFRGPRRHGPAGWLAVACGMGIAVQLGSCLVEASYEGGSSGPSCGSRGASSWLCMRRSARGLSPRSTAARAPDPGHSTRPCRIPSATAAARSETPSFW
jgi:O-antigen ligase